MKKLIWCIVISLFTLFYCKKSPTSPKNTAPNASFTINPTSGTTSTTFTFDASGCSDNEDDASDLQVRWDFDTDGNWETSFDTNMITQHQYDQDATYTIELEVKDSKGSTASTFSDVNISNTAPNASFTVNPTSGTTSTTFTFDAGGSSDNEDDISELQVRWDFDNDGNWETTFDTVKTAQHQYDRTGNFRIELEVKDRQGLTDSETTTITISNTAPKASFTVNPTSGATSTTFTFDATGCSDIEDETSALAVRWDFDNDGIWETGFDTNKIIQHQYKVASSYNAILEVLDSEGMNDTITKTVNVSLACGGQIREDTILSEDFMCSLTDGEAIRILSSNITLDLGGHTISNVNNNWEKIAISVVNVDNVTIKNGFIEGFGFGMDVCCSNNINVENVSIRNMNIAHPDTFIIGINSAECSNLSIKDCVFEFPHEFHKEAIVSYNSYIIVDNMELNGGGCGVNFSFVNECSSEGKYHSNGGIVKNSKFVDAKAGVLVACSNSTLVTNNEFIRNGAGVLSYGPNSGSIDNLIIEDNLIRDGGVGVLFLGVSNSIINNNTIRNNEDGINLEQCHRCPERDSTDRFYSTGNIISNNILTDNEIDLKHHEYSVGNTWINNTCQTKEGAEIPDCTN